MLWRRLRRRKRALPPSGPIHCASAAARLQEFLDAELTDDVADRVSEHLDACVDCGLEADTYRAVKTSLARGQRPSEATLERLRAFAAELTDPSRPPAGR